EVTADMDRRACIEDAGAPVVHAARCVGPHLWGDRPECHRRDVTAGARICLNLEFETGRDRYVWLSDEASGAVRAGTFRGAAFYRHDCSIGDDVVVVVSVLQSDESGRGGLCRVQRLHLSPDASCTLAGAHPYLAARRRCAAA